MAARRHEPSRPCATQGASANPEAITMNPAASSLGDWSSAINAPPTISGTMAVAVPAMRPIGAGSGGGASAAGAGSSVAKTNAKIDAHIAALDFLITGGACPSGRANPSAVRQLGQPAAHDLGDDPVTARAEEPKGGLQDA